MEYSEALNYIHSLMKFGSRPGIERITELLHRLGDPQDKLNIIHVAGTNGKGSTCTFISSVLKESGRKTGLYISPFVCSFNERMQINSVPISDFELSKYVERVRSEVGETYGDECTVTEFEFITAVAFLWFYENGCDAVVLEVGLGGRLDATNVIKKPLCSVIARIALDHTAVLGSTEAEIAFEKCGIIKSGCPTVTTADNGDEAKNVIKSVAKERNSKLFVASAADAEVVSADIFGSKFIYKGVAYSVALPGHHQIANAVIAITAVLAAFGDIDTECVKRGLCSARFPARCEIISQKPLVLLDGSHNPNGTRALADLLKSSDITDATAIVGFMADKDVSEALREVAGCFKKMIAVTVSSNSRTMKAAELRELTRAVCDDTIAAESYEEALKLAEKSEKTVVFGSLYLAGDIRPLLIDRFATKNN